MLKSTVGYIRGFIYQRVFFYPKICRLVQFWVRAAIFIAKNVISLGIAIGMVEFWIARSCKNNLNKVTRVKTQSVHC